MTGPGLDVPVRPIRPADRTGRRAVIAAGVVLAVVAGFAVLPGSAGDESGATAVGPQAPGAPEASRAPATSAGGGSTAPGRRPAMIPLPSFADQVLPGAPVLILVRREGEDAELVAWESGDTRLRQVAAFPGAFRGRLDGMATLAQPSPDGRLLLVRVLGRSGGRADRYRLIDRTGTVLWERADSPFPSVVAWSDDGTALAVTGDDGWIVVEVGARSSAVTERVVPIPDDAGPGADGASARPLLPFSGSIVPVAFSGDGRTIYGAAISLGGPLYAPAVRVSREDGTVTPISAYPTGGDDGLAAGRGAAGRIDPLSGRVFEVARGGGIAVHEADGSLAFRAAIPDRPVLLGGAWVGEGRLLALVADRLGAADAVDLVPIDGDGVPGSRVLSAGPAESAALVAARDGFVLLAFGDADAAVLVLVRVSDGATSTLRVSPADAGDVVGVDLLPAGPG